MTTAVKITLAITIPLVFIIGFLCLAWIFSPTEFTITFQVENETLSTMNNLGEVIRQSPSDLIGQINHTISEEVLG